MITLMVITDGRRLCLERTLVSVSRFVDVRLFDRRIIVNDAVGDEHFIKWVDTLRFDEHVKPGPERRGFAGAIQAGWDNVGDAHHVVHFEDDFEVNRTWDLAGSLMILNNNPHLAQVALRRQPWSQPEIDAGGFVEMWPKEYTDHHEDGLDWLEHRLFFTTNPSVYPIGITRDGWPQQDGSEAEFSRRLFSDPQTKCAFWGRRDAMPFVTHIGEQRVGIGY